MFLRGNIMMIQNKKTIRLGFLIFPGFPMSCLTSAIEPLRAANEIAGQEAFFWCLISEQGQRIASSARVGFDPDMSLPQAEAADLDYLFVLGEPLSVFDNPRRANGVLRSLMRHGAAIGSVSGGVFPLARSGLLEGHTSSVHWCYAAAFETEFPDLQTTDEVILIDHKRLTASGAAAGFDLMLYLIEQRLGAEVTTEVACWFQHPHMRGQGVRQKTPTFQQGSTADMLPEPISRAVRLFSENLENPPGVAEIAQKVGLSARQLERGFKSATGRSPSHYFRMLRMNAARQLAIYSRDTMTEIARAVGYSTPAPLTRHYRETFGVTPQEERRKINQFRIRGNRSLPSS